MGNKFIVVWLNNCETKSLQGESFLKSKLCRCKRQNMAAKLQVPQNDRF